MKKLLYLLITILSIFTISSCNKESKDADIITSCFPIYDLTKRVVGDKMTVSNLVDAGVEPHDYEPTTSDVKSLYDAKLFIVNGLGLEHYTSSLTNDITSKMFTATENISLIYADHHHDEGDTHDHDDNNVDPHVWLNPLNAIIMMENIKNKIIEIDSANEDYYNENYEANKILLEELDNEFKTELESLTSRTIITSHEAFGYLCEAYNLTQLAINGLSSEDEPTAQEIASIIEEIKGLNVTTIFYEELVSDAIARRIAEETGLKCDVLNPIEGLTKNQSDEDYISLMRINLSKLKEALK